MTYVHDARSDTGDLVILDTEALGGVPVATIRLPPDRPPAEHSGR